MAALIMTFPFKIPDMTMDIIRCGGRVKRAVKTLLGKPIYYNDVYLSGEEPFKKLVADMEKMSKLTFDKDGGAD